MSCGDTPALTAPVTTGASETVDCSGETSVANSFAADLNSLPSMLPAYNPFPWHDIRGSSQSCPFECENEHSRLGDYMDPFRLADSKADINMVDVKNNVFELHKGSESLHRRVNARDIFHEIDENNEATADCLLRTAIPPIDYHESEVQMKFKPATGETAALYQMKEHEAEAQTFSFRGSQMPEENSSSGCSTPVFLRAGTFGIRGVNNETNFVPVRFGAPRTVDGGFLKLGLGGGTEIRPNSNFSAREIASKLEESVLSQPNSSLVAQNAPNPSSRTQLLRGNDIQNIASGLQSSAYNFSSRIPTSDEGGLKRDMSAWQNSVPFHNLQTPQSNTKNNFIAKRDNFDRRPLTLPSGSTPIPHPKRVIPLHMGSESIKPTSLGNQVISNQKQNIYQNCFIDVGSGSSGNYLIDMHRRRSSCHAQLGHLSSLKEGTRTQVTGVESFSTSVQPVGQPSSYQKVRSAEALGNVLFPERTMFPATRGNTLHSTGSSPLPRRLGVHFNDSSTTPSATGLPPIQLAAPFNPFRHMVAPPGHQARGIPARLSPNLPNLDNSKGQVVPKVDSKPQASPVARHQSLKRQATENLLTESLAQRRKIIHQPIIHNPVLHQSQRIQAPFLDTLPGTPFHIKWEGFDGPPKPIGEKCLLCKRDLSFTAEGPVYQPTVPPAIAVLSCGHTFHERCLEIITPKDQLNDPPCIPCVIGET